MTATPKTLTDQLANYAAYHRDRRNIATHLVGVPMIVLSVATLLARPEVDLGVGIALAPVHLVMGALVLFYLRLDRRYALVMAAFFAAIVVAAARLAALPTRTWLAAGLGLFAVGWVIQFVGHAWEGRRPAFVDDVIGLLIGPLFVVAEAGFLLGLRREVEREIEARAT